MNENARERSEYVKARPSSSLGASSLHRFFDIELKPLILQRLFPRLIVKDGGDRARESLLFHERTLAAAFRSAPVDDEIRGSSVPRQTSLHHLSKTLRRAQIRSIRVPLDAPDEILNLSI